MRATVALLCVVLASAICACRTASSPAPRDDAYKSVYGSRSGASHEARGTIRGDFQWAAGAPTVRDAALRWEEFLKVHNPPGAEFEDNLHALYVQAAKYELMRVYYLLGRRDDADALLRALDPVGWTK